MIYNVFIDWKEIFYRKGVAFMEIFTLDIIAAVVSTLKYANKDKLIKLYKSIILAYKISEEIDETLSYEVFMADLMKEMGGVGIFENEDAEKKSRPYKAAEIIRTMPEIIPFQYRIADIILENHERIDGTGYPASKDNIAIAAQIIGIADDYLEYGSIEKLVDSKKHELALILALKNILKNAELKSILEEMSKMEEMINDLVNKYNVYKNDLDGVESEQFLMTIASFIDAKHKYTAGHSKRVATYSYVIAKNMGYDEEQLAETRYAAYLHDIGKLAINIDLLDKPDKLTDNEFEIIKNHAKYSFEILNSSQHLKRFAFGALHHERVDGKGYPYGLSGDEISEGAKIIAVADILDALTSNRPYRKPFTFEEAFDLIDMMAGDALDEKVVRAAKDSFGVKG